MALWGLPSKYLLQFRLMDIGLVHWWASALWKPKFRERQDHNYFYSSSYSSSQKSLRQGVNFQVCLLNKWNEKDLHMHIHTCSCVHTHVLMQYTFQDQKGKYKITFSVQVYASSNKDSPMDPFSSHKGVMRLFSGAYSVMASGEGSRGERTHHCHVWA